MFVVLKSVYEGVRTVLELEQLGSSSGSAPYWLSPWPGDLVAVSFSISSGTVLEVHGYKAERVIVRTE